MRAPTVVDVGRLGAVELDGVGVWEFGRVTGGAGEVDEDRGVGRDGG